MGRNSPHPTSISYRTLSWSKWRTYRSLIKNNGHNLTEELCQAIRGATRCLRLKVFSLSSQKILRELACKATSDVSVWIHYQRIKESEELQTLNQNPFVYLHPNTKTHANLLHKKELIVDNLTAFIGTANFTQQSLNNDINCIIKIHSPQICQLMKFNQSESFVIGEQVCKYFSLYRNGPDVVSEIIYQIDNAQNSINLAMFILSHPQILKALDRAYRRGVRIKIILNSTLRKTTFDALQAMQSNIPLLEGTSCGQIHCKMCLIDEKILLMGSSNWTKKGFAMNTENLLMLENLSPKQKSVYLLSGIIC